MKFKPNLNKHTKEFLSLCKEVEILESCLEEYHKQDTNLANYSDIATTLAVCQEISSFELFNL